MKEKGWCKAVLLGVCLLLKSDDALGNLLDRWYWRHPGPQGLTLLSVAYGNGRYVAVGELGTIVTSTNGQEWSLVSGGNSPTLSSVASGGGVFVAVGTGGTILTSTNGYDWSVRVSGVGNDLISVAYNSFYPFPDGIGFIAVGASGVNLKSADGSQWVVKSNFTANTLRVVTVRSGQFLAAGDNNTAFVGDGVTWTQADTSYAVADVYGSPSYRAAVSGMGLRILGGQLYYSGYGGGYVMRSSTTGSSWTASSFAGNYLSQLVTGLAYKGGRFIAVGPTTALWVFYPGVISTSTNGINWEVVSNSENVLNGIVAGSDRFVAVGRYGTIMTSTDGTNWSQAVIHTMTAIQAIAADGNRCIAAGRLQVGNNITGFPNPTAFTSLDGAQWNPSFTNLYGLAIDDLVAAGGLFVGVRGGSTPPLNQSNDVLTTTNGADWVVTKLTNAPPLRGVGYGKGQFIVVGDNGAIWVSFDGSSWTNRSPVLQIGNEGFYSVAYGNGVFVATGPSIAISTNGWDWVLQPAPPAALNRMIFADGKFVATAVGSQTAGHRIFTSTTGTNWTLRYQSGSPTYYAAVANLVYGNGTFLASCGSILWSKDGFQWQPVNSLIANFSMFDYWGLPPVVGFFHGKFIVAGSFSRILQSEDTSVPTASPRLTPLGFRFDYLPKAGDSYRIQTSPDLTTWQTIYESFGDGGSTGFVDFNAATTPKRFFRVLSP